ncbi:YjbH domain-containing protein [Parashewanella curva]
MDKVNCVAAIHLDLMTIKPSTERVGISWLSLQRDGGSMLSRKSSLNQITDVRSPWFTMRLVLY